MNNGRQSNLKWEKQKKKVKILSQFILIAVDSFVVAYELDVIESSIIFPIQTHKKKLKRFLTALKCLNKNHLTCVSHQSHQISKINNYFLYPNIDTTCSSALCLDAIHCLLGMFQVSEHLICSVIHRSIHWYWQILMFK